MDDEQLNKLEEKLVKNLEEKLVKNLEEEGFNTTSIQKVFGIILLIPPLLGILFFVLAVFGADVKVFQLREFATFSGWISGSGIPLYLGLMAIAGAILLASDKKK